MSLKKQARNRLLMLLAGVVLVGGLAGGAVFYRDLRAQRKFADFRARGMAAAAAGNDSQVVNLLGQYLRRHPSDIEAMAAYAKSRPRVIDPDAPQGQNLLETATVLRNLLRAAPDRVEDWRELMKLNYSFQRYTEANDAADNLLIHKPGDGEALEVQASSLYTLKRYYDALRAAEARVATDPKDWNTQIIRLETLKALNRGPDVILQTAQSVANKFPNEQGALLVQTIAYELTDDPTNAQVKLTQAAAMPVHEPAVGAMMVRLLDLMSMQTASMQVLKQLSDEGDRQAQKMMLRRLWEQNRFNEAIKLYAAASTQPSTAPSELSAVADSGRPLDDSESLGLYSVALKQRNQESARAGVLATLSARKDDPMATAWLAVATNYPATDRVKAKTLADACRAALALAPQDPYLFYFEASASTALGDTDKAIEYYGQAAQYSVTWAMPLVERAQEYLTLNGHIDDALRDSIDAFRRDPTSTAAAVTNAMVLYAIVDGGSNDPKLIPRLNDLIDEIQAPSHSPGEIQTLRIRAALQARAGDTATAVGTIHSLLNATTPLPIKLYLSLANISREFKLGVEGECIAALEKAYGRTPESAITLALDDFTQKKGDEGLKLLQDSIASAKDSQRVGFRLAMASYLEATRDPGSAASWVALGDDYPQELTVQRAALASASANTNRDFVSRTIDRLHSLLGDNSTVWKIARAKWLLEGPSNDKNTADAIALLQDVLRRDPSSLGGNIMMGMALQNTGDVAKATTYFINAAKLDPNSAGMKMDLARLYQYRGDFDSARQQLEQAASQEKNPADLTNTAMLMASQGDVDGAIKILEPLASAPGAAPKTRLFLISLYSRSKQFDKAQALSDSLMRDNPDAATIVTAAQLDMFQRHIPQAEAKLSQLKSLKWEPGQYEITLGDFRFSFGLLDQALVNYRAATAADPKNPLCWMKVIDCEAAMELIPQMQETANQAVAQLPANLQTDVLAVQRQIPLMLKAGIGETQKQLFTAIVRDPSPDHAPVTTLSAMVQLMGLNTPDEVLQGLIKLSLSLPKFLPAQTALTETQLRLGRAEDAVQSATRTVLAFPNDYYPAKLGVDALTSLQRWPEALEMAQKWKDRVVGDSTEVDMKISQIQLAMGNNDAALAALAPHLSAAYLLPDQKWQMQLIQARALSAQQKTQQAVDSLWDTVTNWQKVDADSDPRLRAANQKKVLSAYMDFCVYTLSPDQAAEQLTRVSDWLKTQPDSQSDLVPLAVQWDYLAVKSGFNTTYGKTARDMMAALAQNSDPVLAAAALWTQGGFNEEDADFAAAQASYRSAIAKGTQAGKAYPEFKNNLAMVLADHGGNLNEALDLAQQCIKLAPGSPASAPYYDTLAYLQDKARNFPAAAEAMKEACSLQPANAKWHVNLARMQLEAGQRDLARQTLAELAVMSPGPRSLQPDYQARLADLNKQLNVTVRTAATHPAS